MRSKRISRISSPPVAAGPALWRALARRRLAGRKPQAPEQDPRSRAHRRCSQAVDWRRACRRRQSASPGGYGFMLLDFRALRRASQSTSGSPHRSPKCRRRARSRRDMTPMTPSRRTSSAPSRLDFLTRQCRNRTALRLPNRRIDRQSAQAVLLFQGDEIRGPRRPVGLDQAEYPSARTVPTAAMPAAFDRKRRRDATST
jgi:hypothetical protein